MVTRRPGHSLPELIVTVTFLAVGLGGVGASSVLGARWVTDGLRRQEGVRLAAAALDSLTFAPAPVSGSRQHGPWRIRWTVEGDAIGVTAETLADDPVVELEGRLAPVVPVLPDPAPAGGP